jgi:hypothetical protein
MKQTLKTWWDGTCVPAPKNDPNSSAFILSLGTYERSLSSRTAHALVDFWMKHWQWCFSATFTTVGLFIAALKL